MEDVRQELDLWCGIWVIFWKYETEFQDAIGVIAFMADCTVVILRSEEMCVGTTAWRAE